MKTKTRLVSGIPLDWLVSQIEKESITMCGRDLFYAKDWDGTRGVYTPTNDWSVAGPIIEREGIDTRLIKHRPYSYFGYYGYARNPGAYKPGTEVIMVARDIGPDRMVREPRARSDLSDKWIAHYATGSDATVKWDVERDMLGDTLLEAAMRCFVRAKMGNEVEFPDQLLERKKRERQNL